MLTPSIVEGNVHESFSLPLEGRVREGSSFARKRRLVTRWTATVAGLIFFTICKASHAQFPVIQGDFDISPLKTLRINYVLKGKLSGDQTLYIGGNRALVEIEAGTAAPDNQKLSLKEYYSPEAKIVYDAARQVGRKADNVAYYRKQQIALLSKADRRYYEKHRGQAQSSELSRLLGGTGAEKVSFLGKQCDVYRRPNLEVYLWKNIVVKMKVPALKIDMEATGIYENPKIPEDFLALPVGMPIAYDEKYSRAAKAGVDSLILAIKNRKLDQTPPRPRSGSK